MPRTLADPEVEVDRRLATADRPRRCAVAALAPGPLGRGRSPGRRPAVAAWASWSPTPRASTPCRSASTSAGWSCASTSRPRRGPPTRPPIAGRPTIRRSSRSSAARRAVIAGYGSIGREVARQLAALGMRIIAVKPRPEVRDDIARTGCRARATPTARSPSGSSADAELVEVAHEADLLVLTMPLDRRLARDRRSLRSSPPCRREPG